ncbi:major allergen Api g 1, isoallergen 1-like [Panicum miliaceum]|uniref:Major allergen Api g 1, isoallergen 1-like n=1 Tax=Panicum miliaceum TaxID=4540 RepID=A0A3L6T161_PANMI|nr:major allergen Api g 1, isoallergen 1-like [Panicum miliaceum]
MQAAATIIHHGSRAWRQRCAGLAALGRVADLAPVVACPPAIDGAWVATVMVEYERHGGAPLAPEDQARLAQGYLGLPHQEGRGLPRRHPGEFA